MMKKKGFTLIELLVVIVVLAIILGIAILKTSSVVKNSKKSALESTAKMIAGQAENQMIQNSLLGNDENITCESVSNLNEADYAYCDILFDGNKALVTIEGKGKFDGLYVCNGTKTAANASDVACITNCNDGYHNMFEKQTIISYSPKDIDACVDFFSSSFLEYYSDYYWEPWDETDLRSVCNGDNIGESPDNLDYKMMIDYFMEIGLVTKKELIQKKLIDGIVENFDVCAPKPSETAVSFINKIFFDENLRHAFGLEIDNTVDQNIRYVGNKAQNYVEFGNINELWRIIGIFQVKKANGSVEKLLKIVRSEPFTEKNGNTLYMSWDSSSSGYLSYGYGSNQWINADLKTMLNGYYIGESTVCTYCNGRNQETCTNNCSDDIIPLSSVSIDMIEDIVWNIGESPIADSLTKLELYNNERARTYEWIGKVGLIYPSDSSYAGGSLCTYAVGSPGKNCSYNNWLKETSSFATITPVKPYAYASPQDSEPIWIVTGNNSFWGETKSSASTAYGVRPAVYLKSNVQIIGGDGSINNPYKLGV